MAETDASRTAAEPLTTEEAERLSEQFRPSWEEDPPTVKREQSAPRPVVPQPAPPQPAPPVPRAPVVSVTGPQAAPAKTQAAPAKPAPTPLAGATTAPGVPLALARRATLLGGAAPQPPKAEGSAPRGQGVDDLDWEDPSSPVAAPPAVPLASPGAEVAVLLTRPAAGSAAVVAATGPERGPDDTQKLPAVAAAATTKRDDADFEVHVEVEELPPESKPSGIGQKYIPKEEGAPPVVLGADIEAAERGASVDLEAEHRRRRAPTILKMKAIEAPPAAPVDAVPDFAAPRRKGGGLLVVLAVLTLVGGAAAAAFLVRGGAPSEPAKPADPAAALTAPTEVTPRPVVEAAPAAKAGAQEAASPPPEEPSKVAPLEKTEAASAAPAAPAVTTAAKPAARPAPAKTAKPTGVGSPKPAAGPRPSSPSSAKGAIVRDTPF
jgi:hypothetical protein